MSWLEKFDNIIDYIEKNLDQEINYEDIADIIGYSSYHFRRLFLMTTGISVTEYIRNRRLSEAAVMLEQGNKAIDVGIKYQYNTAASFTRAFKAMHGITPKEAQKGGVIMKTFPPLSYRPILDDGEMLSYKIVELESFRIIGQKINTTTEDGLCYKQIPELWNEFVASSVHQHLLTLMNTNPMGLMGISDYSVDRSKFDYYIGVSSSIPLGNDLHELMIPQSTWAVFQHSKGLTGDIQQFQRRILFDWLPTSGYEFSKAPDVEVYGQYGDVETWIPVRRIGIK